MWLTKIASKHLWWKELRQLWPLAASSIVVVAFIQVLAMLNRNMRNDEMIGIVEGLLVGLPSLFAVGVGAMLVGQEKEQRTIQWLSCLPVSKHQIISSKLSIGIIGLILMWLVSLLLVGLLATSDGSDISMQILRSHVATWTDVFEAATYPLHSLFLLLAGLALAWRFSSSFLSLAGLVVVALIPYVICWIIFHALSSFVDIAHDARNWVPPPALLIPCQLIGCAAAWILGNRWARVALGPAAGQIGLKRAVQATKPLGSPFGLHSALIWQFAAQNKHLLTTIFLMLAVAASLFLISRPILRADPNHQFLGVFASIGGILVSLATSWLGVSVFQGDSLNRRVRFLADRGVSPRTTWVTRQVVPLVFLGLASFVGALGLALLAGSQSIGASDIFLATIVPAVAAYFTVYAVSQWVGQSIVSPILSAIAGPAISIAAVFYLIFCYGTLGSPALLLVIAVLLLPLGSFIQTNRWMDQRFDRKYWLTQLATVGLFLLVPLTPIFYALATTRSMSSDVRAEMTRELEGGQWKHNLIVKELVLQSEKTPNGEFESMPAGSSQTEGAQPEDSASDQASKTPTDNADTERKPQSTIAARTDFALSSLQKQMDESSVPVRPTMEVLAFLQAELSACRTKLVKATANSAATTGLDASTESSAGNDAVALREPLSARYDSLVELAASIVVRTRQSIMVMDQEMADRLEILLVRELQQAKKKDLIGSQAFDKAAAVLGNSVARNAARRRAIPSSWLPSIDGRMDLRSQIIARGKRSRVVELLWKLANATNEDTTQLRLELATTWGLPPEYYGIGAVGKCLRADDLENFLWESREAFRMAPGSQWHADWERQAQQLTNVAP